jgi:hypothetical protein
LHQADLTTFDNHEGTTAGRHDAERIWILVMSSCRLPVAPS